MQSRGLSRAQAVHVIVEGFFEPLIGELQDERLEQLLRDRVGEKLAAAAEDIDAYAAAR
jgi:Fe-S cluster assembly scaffold protein SufB